MKINFYRPKMISHDEYNSLWNQGVNMDDWDYIIMVNPGEMELIPERMFGWGYAKYEHYDGVEFRGKYYDIVIAYH